MRSRRIGSSSRTILSRPHIPEMINDDLQHIIAEWTNMSGFLCSLGGVATGGGRSIRPMSTVPSASSVESLTTLNMYSSTRWVLYMKRFNVCMYKLYILNSVMVLKWCMLIIGVCLLIKMQAYFLRTRVYNVLCIVQFNCKE